MNAAWAELEQALARRGAGAFLRLERLELSADEALARASRAGARLHALGAEAGELVGVLGERSAACVLTLLALWSRGLVTVLLNPLEPRAAREATLARAGCRTWIGPRDAAPPLAWEDLLAENAARGPCTTAR